MCSFVYMLTSFPISHRGVKKILKVNFSEHAEAAGRSEESTHLSLA